MKELMVDINSILKIKAFVNISVKYSYDITLSSENYSVSAKSIMGIFTLDISKPIKLTITSNNCEDYVNEIKSFIVSIMQQHS